MKQNLDKSKNAPLIRSLEKLGLTEKEARVYVYLMGRTAEIGTSKIVAATGLHGQYVYNALAALEAKGLVKHVIKSNRKKWSANPPARITTLVEEKRTLASTVEDMLGKIFVERGEQEFEIYQGEDQFIANAFQTIEEAEQNSFIYIIGGDGSRFSELLKNQDIRKLYNAKSIAKNITIRYIGTEDQAEWLTWAKSNRSLFEYRVMPGFSTSTVSTSIYPSSVQFQIYGDPLLVVKLKSKQIAEDYKNFFESLWALCAVR